MLTVGLRRIYISFIQPPNFLSIVCCKGSLDELGDDAAFVVDLARLEVGVDNAEFGVLIILAELVELVDENLVRDVDDLVDALPLDAEEVVEFVAEHNVIALDRGSDIAVLAVPADADVVERDGFGVDFVESAEFDFCAARKVFPVFFNQLLKLADGVLLELPEVLLRFGEKRVELGGLLAVLLDVEQ